jgi:hypothetical protein
MSERVEPTLGGGPGTYAPPPRGSDPVNHPSHYTSHPSGIECIDVIEHMTLNIGAAIKYLWRCGLKSEATHIQDLEKAAWHIRREIQRLTTQTRPRGIFAARLDE